MNKNIEKLKCIYHLYTNILKHIELMQEESEFRTIKYNKKLIRLRNRNLKDMDILYKVIKELGGI